MAIQRIGDYRVERLLGKGAFAAVWLAFDEQLDDMIAVKVLEDDWSQHAEISARFLQEARLLRRISDERVVRVHSLGHLDDQRPYFVMEYADRGTLEDRLAARRASGQPYGSDEAVSVGVEILRGLTVVHDCDVIHRDVKPSNVLYRSLPARRFEAGSPTLVRERTLLGDFGIARRLDRIKAPTLVGGTPAYMAPEQADTEKAQQVDARADIYAVGAVIFELLAFETPFTEREKLDFRPRPHHAMARLRELRPDVPDDLVVVIERALAFEPAERFASAAEFAQALMLAWRRSQPGGMAVAHLRLPNSAVVPLEAGSYGLGRSDDSDIVIDDPEASRQHCRLAVSASGEGLVTDLDSTNGVVVDGAAVGSASLTGRHRLLLGTTDIMFESHPEGGCEACLAARQAGP